MGNFNKKAVHCRASNHRAIRGEGGRSPYTKWISSHSNTIGLLSCISW